jgi:hypothetical protein
VLIHTVAEWAKEGVSPTAARCREVGSTGTLDGFTGTVTEGWEGNNGGCTT